MAAEPWRLELDGVCKSTLASDRPAAVQFTVDGFDRGTLLLDVRLKSPLPEGQGLFLCMSKGGFVPDVAARSFHWVSKLSLPGTTASFQCRIHTHFWVYGSPDAIVLLQIATEAPQLHPDNAVFTGVYFDVQMDDSGEVSADDIGFEAKLRFESELSMLPTEELRLAHIAFHEAFADVDGLELSAKGKESMGRDGDMELTYGEVQFGPFWEVIRRIVAPRPGETFLDLGSGTGRAVLTAAIAFPELASCMGYEVVPSLHAAAEKLERRLRAELKVMAPVRLVGTDFRELPWHEGVDILWVSSLCMEEETMRGIACQAVKLRPGARVVTMDQFFGEDMLELQRILADGLEPIPVEMNFGEANVYVWRVAPVELETMD